MAAHGPAAVVAVVNAPMMRAILDYDFNLLHTGPILYLVVVGCGFACVILALCYHAIAESIRDVLRRLP